MLEQETLLYWFASQRVRLTTVDVGLTPEVDAALDDLVAICAYTESPRLAQACDDLLKKEMERCGLSA